MHSHESHPCHPSKAQSYASACCSSPCPLSLLCSHEICVSCFPIPQQFCEQLVIICPRCSVMSMISSNAQKNRRGQGESNSQSYYSSQGYNQNKKQRKGTFDIDSYVVCRDCRSGVMSMKEFLASSHRKCQVVAVCQILHQVNKGLARYQIQFQLQIQTLYNKISQISKQKQSTSQCYYKTTQKIQSQFQSLRSAVALNEKICLETYQSEAQGLLFIYNQQILSIKDQILCCQSYLEGIVRKIQYREGRGDTDASAGLAAVQFYYGNLGNFQKVRTKLIEKRVHQNESSLKGGPLNKQPKTPNLLEIEQIMKKIEGLSERIWANADKSDQIKTANQQKNKQNHIHRDNPQNEIQRYFIQKKKQIFNDGDSRQGIKNSRYETSIKNSKIQNNRVSKLGTGQPLEPFNIQGRIENLRKILKLGQNNRCKK